MIESSSSPEEEQRTSVASLSNCIPQLVCYSPKSQPSAITSTPLYQLLEANRQNRPVFEFTPSIPASSINIYFNQGRGYTIGGQFATRGLPSAARKLPPCITHHHASPSIATDRSKQSKAKPATCRPYILLFTDTGRTGDHPTTL